MFSIACWSISVIVVVICNLCMDKQDKTFLVASLDLDTFELIRLLFTDLSVCAGFECCSKIRCGNVINSGGAMVFTTTEFGV